MRHISATTSKLLYPDISPGVLAAIADMRLEWAKRDERLLDFAEKNIHNVIGLCESPIEELMLVSLAFTNMCNFNPSGCINLAQAPIFGDLRPHIIPQCVIGCYRLDFAVRCVSASERVTLIAIECDGNQHHNMTVQQTDRDTVRDGFMLQMGIKTHRFTGREIYKLGPVALCEVLDQIIIEASK